MISVWKFVNNGKAFFLSWSEWVGKKSQTCLSKHNAVGRPATIFRGLADTIGYYLWYPIWYIDAPTFCVVEVGSTWEEGSLRWIALWVKQEQKVYMGVFDESFQSVGGLDEEQPHGILWLPHLLSHMDEELSQALTQLQVADDSKRFEYLFIASDNLYSRRELYNVEAQSMDTVAILDKIFRKNSVSAGDMLSLNVENQEPLIAKIFQQRGDVLSKQSVSQFFVAYRLPWETELSVEDRALIPRFDPDEVEIDGHIEHLAKLIHAEGTGPSPVRNILLYGEAGSGKSTAAKLLAQALGLPYRFLNLSLNAEEADLRGSFMPHPDGTFRFETTPFLEAAKRGGIIELMEINYARPGVLGILNSFMDDNGALVAGNGEVVRRHKNCIIVATTNVNYAGCLPMNQALKDRFHIMQEIKKMPKETLVKLVQRRTGLDDEVLVKKLVDVVEIISAKIREEGIE